MSRLAILVGPHSRGSNMMAIVRACQDRRLEAEVATVIAPSEAVPAIASARGMGVRVDIVAPGDDYGGRLLEILRQTKTDIVCLAGYLRLLPAEVLEQFPRRVLNIHPALLPRHGGKGMYGMRVHEAVLASGDTESGATVHFVTERYDEGDILLQRRCPVLPGDTPATLAGRVLELEHATYVEALRSVLRA